MKFRHGEAFCLMTYECATCGHQERIWNSRDGVTPFGSSCPSCGENELRHADFRNDTRVINHELHPWQKFWRDGTAEEAIAILERRFKRIAQSVNANADLSPGEKSERLDHYNEALAKERMAVRAGTSQGFPTGWPKLDVHMPNAGAT